VRYRVLMVGPGLELVGGIATLASNLVPALSRSVNLHYLPTASERALKDSGRMSARNVALAISQYARFLYALGRFRPQIIHIHTSQGFGWLKDLFFVLAGKLHGCRTVLHVNAFDHEWLYDKWPRIIRYYVRTIATLADAVIAVSGEWREWLAEIVPRDHLWVVRNCVPVTMIPDPPSDHYGKEPVALFLGSIGPRKGAYDLFEAMGKLGAAGLAPHLLMAGYEEGEGELARARARVRELMLQDHCKLLGSVAGAEKLELLRAANLFVLPSYHEGLPLAMLEAMAAGLPVLATPVGGIPELIQDGYNGFLVSPGDVDALADRLCLLSGDAHLREVMGRRNREIAERQLDVRPCVGQIVALYGAITGF